MADGRGSDFLVNDAIKDYIFDLHQCTRFSRVQSEVDALYGAKFQELSKQYYGDKTAWPAPSTIANLTPDPKTGKGEDEFFLCFYKEMADRHLFASGRPSAMDRITTWNNYCALLDQVIACGDTELVLNEQWAFDLIHEFVYSFQGFAQFRADLARRDQDGDLQVLADHPDAWSVHKVGGYLRKLIAVSNVEAILTEARAAGTPLDITGKAPSRMHFDLGYFALVGLSRLECLLGDYHASLAALECVDLFAPDKEYYSRVFACYHQIFYHAGVSYLMMRRYKDAIRTLGHVVSHINRLAKTGALFHVAAGAEEQNAKKAADRCAALLSIAHVLTPGTKATDVVHSMPKEAARQFEARLAQLEQATDGADLEQVFEKACPKFVSGAPPPLGPALSGQGGQGALVNKSHEPVRRQVDLFSQQASQQLGLAKIRSFLKLYTSIEVSKLAKFHGSTPDEFRSELLASKHLLSQTECAAGLSPLDGAVKSALDVHFFVEGGLIQIDDEAAGGAGEGTVAGDLNKPRHEHFFMEEMARCDAVEAQVTFF